MSRSSRLIFYILLILIALLGMAALWRSTPYGLGLVNDSAYYIEGADNLLAGKGYVRTSGGGEVKPITHFPPFFSLLLAAFSLSGLELLPAARLLVTVLFGLTILLTGLSAQRISRSPVFGLLGALLLASSDVFLGVFSMALSEPLFLALMLAAFLALANGLERPSWGWLVMRWSFTQPGDTHPLRGRQPVPGRDPDRAAVPAGASGATLESAGMAAGGGAAAAPDLDAGQPPGWRGRSGGQPAGDLAPARGAHAVRGGQEPADLAGPG